MGLQNRISLYGEDILGSDTYQRLRSFVQHGRTSTYEHCLNVAATGLRIADALGLPGERAKVVVRGALLHDYYLYDWHKKKTRLHGLTHPRIALKNAEADFLLSNTERDVIKKHMFPLTIVPPRYIESWVVSFADKVATVWEVANVCKNPSYDGTCMKNAKPKNCT